VLTALVAHAAGFAAARRCLRFLVINFLGAVNIFVVDSTVM